MVAAVVTNPVCVCVRGLRLVRVGGWGDDVSGVAGVLTELMDLAKGVD